MMRFPKLALSGLLFLTLLISAPFAFAQHENLPAQGAEEGMSARPWLGVSIQEVNEETARQMGMENAKGVLVADVAKGGPADQAGLNMGDVIEKFNGQAVSNADDFINKVRSASVGSMVALEVNRGGETRNINVKLAQMPSSAMMGGPMGQQMGMAGGSCTGTGKMEKGSCSQYGRMGGAGQSCQDCASQCGQKCGQHCDKMGKGRGMMHGRGYGMQGMPGMMGGPGTMMLGHMYGKVMRSVKALNLTPDQKAKAGAINSALMKKAIKAGSDIKVAGLELHDLLAAEPVNMDKVKAKVNEIASKNSDLLLSGIKSLEEFKKLLTPEQKGKLKDLLAMESGGMDDAAAMEAQDGGMEMEDSGAE